MRFHKVLILAVLVILVSGATCERGEKTVGAKGPFVGGFDGLEINFLDDAPPSSGIFEKEPFPVELELINKGETAIGDGAVEVKLVGTVTSNSFVRTKDKTNNEGELFAVELSAPDSYDSILVGLGDIKYQPSPSMVEPSYTFNVVAQACYPYRTKVQLDNFCIPSEQRKPVGSEECEVDSKVNLVQSGDNSAGPLQVTSVTESKGVGYVKLRIDINNQGTGEVINCGSGVRDMVSVNLPQGVDCSEFGGNSGTVQLRNGHAVLHCRKDVSNQGPAYLDRFPMTLAYDYMQEVTKAVTVNKAD